jgi:hypothetical protein
VGCPYELGLGINTLGFSIFGGDIFKYLQFMHKDYKMCNVCITTSKQQEWILMMIMIEEINYLCRSWLVTA